MCESGRFVSGRSGLCLDQTYIAVMLVVSRKHGCKCLNWQRHQEHVQYGRIMAVVVLHQPPGGDQDGEKAKANEI